MRWIMEKKYKTEMIFTIAFWIAGAVGVAGLLLFPDKLYFEAIAYSIMAMISITGVANFSAIAQFATYDKSRPLDKKLYGVGQNPIFGLVIGVVFGVLFLIITKIKIFAVLTMAIPTLPLALSGQGWVVTYIAPVIETLFFGVFYLSLLNLFMPFWLAIIIRGVTFSAFHYWAYVVIGSSTVSSIFGAFVGAFAFSIMGSFLCLFIGAEADASAHGFFNFWQWNSVYHVLSVAG